jgi:hypothetical protein
MNRLSNDCQRKYIEPFPTGYKVRFWIKGLLPCCCTSGRARSSQTLEGRLARPNLLNNGRLSLVNKASTTALSILSFFHFDKLDT